MGCLVGDWTPGERSRYRFVSQQCKAWEWMRILGKTVGGEEDQVYKNNIGGASI